MSLDSGSRNIESPKDSSDEPTLFELTHTGDALVENTPKGDIDPDLEQHLVNTTPNSVKDIDPDTLEVPYTPYAPPRTERKGIKRYIAGGVAITTLAGLGIFAATRGDSSNDPNDVPRVPSAGSTPTPGSTSSAEPTPSPSATEQLSDLEKQRALFEKLQIPASSITAAQLLEYKNATPDALDLFKGVDGGIGLYPNIEQDLQSQRLAFGSMKADDLSDAMDRYEAVLTGTHLDVVNGKVVEVSNQTFAENGLFNEVVSKDLIKQNSQNLDSESIAAAGTLASVGRNAVSIKIAAQLMLAEGRVAEFYNNNPDVERLTNETGSSEVIASIYAQDKTLTDIEGRISAAKDVANGESIGISLPNYSDSRIVDVMEQSFKTADGKTTVTVLGASLVGKDEDGTYFTQAVVLLPAQHALGPDKTDVSKFVLTDAPKGSYNVFLLSKTSAN